MSFALLGIVLAILLAALGAWPGGGPYWRSLFVMNTLGAVPSSIVTADFEAHTFAGIPLSSGFWAYVATKSPVPEATIFDVLIVALSYWMAMLYFPAVRGWRMAVYMAVCAALLIAIPGTY